MEHSFKYTIICLIRSDWQGTEYSGSIRLVLTENEL